MVFPPPRSSPTKRGGGYNSPLSLWERARERLSPSPSMWEGWDGVRRGGFQTRPYRCRVSTARHAQGTLVTDSQLAAVSAPASPRQRS